MHDPHDHDDHEHDHSERDFQPDLEDTHPPSDYAYLEVAVRELLVEKGVVTNDDIRRAIEKMDERGPHLGAQCRRPAPGSMKPSRPVCSPTAPRPARSSASM